MRPDSDLGALGGEDVGRSGGEVGNECGDHTGK
jgi:hypothetical protein